MRSSRERDEGEVRSLPSAEPTAALVLRTLEGDRWAADGLYRRYAREVYRVATVLLGRDAEVEDLVQDAFVKAFQKLDTLRDRATFGGWVTRIAANLSRSRLRRRSLLRRLGLDRGEEDVSFDRLAAPALDVERRTELRRLAELVRTFDADERVAWTLRRVEGWPLAEIGEAVGASLATVKRRVARADERVARHVKGGRR